jgi:hypothetical protein
VEWPFTGAHECAGGASTSLANGSVSRDHPERLRRVLAAVVGTATATFSERIIVGSFSGTLKLVERHSRATLGECQATDHRMEFTR